MVWLCHKVRVDADGHPDFKAGGQDWRTVPLWGVNLFPIINNPGFYLHDGRARAMTEVMMWQGGEAAPSQSYFSHLPKADRDAILKFLGSL